MQGIPINLSSNVVLFRTSEFDFSRKNTKVL